MAQRNRDVFVNAPFDKKYEPLFYAITFAVIRYGYRMRCALEVDDSSESRFSKICSIIEACKFGIHDISRTEPDGDPPLPRFNMPLELGLFLGAKRFGDAAQKRKTCLIFDRERHRYQRLMSDIAGQDIHSHGDKPKTAIKEVTAWLRGQPGGDKLGGGDSVWSEYTSFKRGTLQKIYKDERIKASEFGFKDFADAAAIFVASL